jgi:branched-chain amino acid transport system permease protein
MKLHLPFLITLPLSGFVSIVIALILGKIVLRARGVYFVLITFSFTEITRLIFVNWVSLFGGANGISNIPAPRIPLLFRSGVVTVSTKGSYYYLTLVVLVLSLVALLRITKSPMGNVFRILRESELLSQSLGVDVSKYKLIGFTIASFFAGIVGCLYAHYYRYISPHAFTFWESVYVVMICVIGGFKNLKGAVIGSAVFVFLTEAVRAGKEYQLIIFGVVIIVTVIFCPGGLEGLFTTVGNRITGLRKLTALNPES